MNTLNLTRPFQTAAVALEILYLTPAILEEIAENGVRTYLSEWIARHEPAIKELREKVDSLMLPEEEMPQEVLYALSVTEGGLAQAQLILTEHDDRVNDYTFTLMSVTAAHVYYRELKKVLPT